MLFAVHTTVATREAAHRIAHALVRRKLAACVQIEAIESVYIWQGAVQQEPEFRLQCKTTGARCAAVHAVILELHPYDLPAIHSVVLADVHPPYAAWIEAGCTGDPVAASDEPNPAE
jgi:periplasmic divalent cation tolerance protein